MTKRSTTSRNRNATTSSRRERKTRRGAGRPFGSTADAPRLGTKADQIVSLYRSDKRFKDQRELQVVADAYWFMGTSEKNGISLANVLNVLNRWCSGWRAKWQAHLSS